MRRTRAARALLAEGRPLPRGVRGDGPHARAAPACPAQMIDVAAPGDARGRRHLGAVGRDRVPGRAGRDAGRSGSSARPTRTRARSCWCEAAQRVGCADRACASTARSAATSPSRLAALDRRGVVGWRALTRTPSCPAILAGLDAAVIPSLWWDCAPLVVAECLAGRVPVVGRRMGGITDFVEHERNGLLFDGRSAPRSSAALDAPRTRARPARAPAGAASRRRKPFAAVRRRARGDATPAARLAAQPAPDARRRALGRRPARRLEPGHDQPRGRERRLRRHDGLCGRARRRRRPDRRAAAAAPARRRGAPPVAARLHATPASAGWR